MKTNLIKRMACLAAVSAVLVWAGGGTRAYAVDDVIWTFDSAAPGWAINPWGGAGQGAASGEDAANGNPAGSFQVFDNFGAPGQDQLVNLGWFAGATYDTGAATTNLLLYTNIVFDVMWDTADSTMSISTFNSTGETLQLWAIPNNNASWIDLGSIPIPANADTGWQKVNLPVNITLPGISTIRGLGFKKWTDFGHTGFGVFWVDNVTLQRDSAPPPPPTLTLASSVKQGLNLYSSSGVTDRQNIGTVVTNGESYAWYGNPTPVVYSLAIAQFPTNNGFQAHFMLMPGNNIAENAPDWNEANAMVLFIVNQTNGTVLASLRYKLNQPSGNSYLYGSDTNVFGGGGSAVTNTIVAGYGGLLGSVTNSTSAVGTWSITISQNTNITIHTPDGQNATCFFPQDGDAQAFAYPLTVFWGTQPNTASLIKDVVFSNVSITGSTNSLNVDLTQPLDPTKMALRGVNNALIFATPTNAVYWLQWSLPDAGYGLESASSLLGPWTAVVGAPVITTNFLNRFDTAGSITNTRTYNPPPMWVGYDYGNATANTNAWASGPTYDAGASGASGSLELNWTWNYTANGAGSADFTLDLSPSAMDCSGGTLSFDVRVNSSSTPGVYNDYGYFQVASRAGNYATTFTSLGEGLLAAAGGAVDQWGHVSIPLTGADSQIRALTFQDYNDAGRAIVGSETIYIDNLQITKSTATGPTVYSISGKHSVYVTSPMLPSSGAGFFRLVKP